MKFLSPYVPKLAKVLDVIEETPDIKTLKLRYIDEEEQRRFSFRPGQFAEVSVFGYGEAPFAIASSPSRSSEHFEVSVRAVGTVTRAIHALKPGDIVGVRAPLGKGFPIENFYDMNVIVLAGGTGLFAVSSLLHYICEHRHEFRDVVLLYGSREPRLIPRRYDLDYWSKYIDVYLTVDKPDETWRGFVGVVTQLLDKVPTPRGPHTVACVCGPPIMMRVSIPKLLSLGISRNRIYLSLEWKMQCGIGKCGHCMLSNGKYVCLDGPVFALSEIREEDIR